MTGDCHVRFLESVGVKFPSATRLLHFIIGLNVMILTRMRFQQLKSVRIIASYEDAKCVL
jgi:hypothetical protein